MTAQDLYDAFRRVEHRHYMREYMNEKRAEQRKHRICPDCGVRNVEYRCRYCSECAEIRHAISVDISDHNKRMRNQGVASWQG